jgi:hypothetical protein
MERNAKRRLKRRQNDRGTGAGAPGLAAVMLGLGVVVAAHAQTSAKPQAPAHTAAECADLIKQYDVAAPAHRGAPHADEAARDRSSGEQACQAGHYNDGVAALRRALHGIGVKPVRISPSPTT